MYVTQEACYVPKKHAKKETYAPHMGEAPVGDMIHILFQEQRNCALVRPSKQQHEVKENIEVRSPHVPGGSSVPGCARSDRRGGRTQVTKEGIHGKNIDKHNYLPIKYQSGCPIRSLVLFGSASPGILIQKGS